VEISAGASKRFDIPHLNHGGRKFREGGDLVGAAGGKL